jgi:GTP cyclohydrolase I
MGICHCNNEGNKVKSNSQRDNDKDKKTNTLIPEKVDVNVKDEKNSQMEEKKINEMIKEQTLTINVNDEKERNHIKVTSDRVDNSLEEVLNGKSENRENLNCKEKHMIYKCPKTKPLYILV